MPNFDTSKPFRKNPGVFSLKRLFVITDALMFSVTDGKKTPLDVVRHGIRGTQNINDKNKKTEITQIQMTDSAKLPEGASELLVSFDIRLLPLTSCITSLNAKNATENADYRESFAMFAQKALESEGLMEVCRRFARNILNGRWLWRNRTIAQSITISARSNEVLDVAVDALALPLSNFDNYTEQEQDLADALAQGLKDNSRAVIRIEARLRFGTQGPLEVFPSQNYVEGKPKGLARLLYTIGHARSPASQDPLTFEASPVIGQAALRDQKVLNAIRTIDTWYPDFEEYGKPISVEPLGANLEAGEFFRSDVKTTAFDMARRFHLIDPNSAEGMFLIASLTRGGVYSEKEPKKEPNNEDNEGETQNKSEE